MGTQEKLKEYKGEIMRLFRKRKKNIDSLEQKLDIISDLTRGLGRKELNALLEAVKGMYDVRQNLKNVKTDDEKEYGDIDESERILEKEKGKKNDNK